MVSLKDKCKLSEAVNGLEESWMLNVLFTQDSGASADVCCLATPYPSPSFFPLCHLPSTQT